MKRSKKVAVIPAPDFDEPIQQEMRRGLRTLKNIHAQQHGMKADFDEPTQRDMDRYLTTRPCKRRNTR